MICRYCGYNQPDGATHCAACGRPLGAPAAHIPPGQPAQPAAQPTLQPPQQAPAPPPQNPPPGVAPPALGSMPPQYNPNLPTVPPPPPPQMVYWQSAPGPQGPYRQYPPNQPPPPGWQPLVPGAAPPQDNKKGPAVLIIALVAIALAIAFLVFFLVVFLGTYRIGRVTVSASTSSGQFEAENPESTPEPDSSLPSQSLPVYPGLPGGADEKAAQPQMEPDPSLFSWLTEAADFQPSVDGEVTNSWEAIEGSWYFCYIDDFEDYDLFIYMKAVITEYDPELYPNLDPASNAVVLFQQQYQVYSDYGVMEPANASPFSCGAIYNSDGSLTVTFPDGTVDTFTFWQYGAETRGFTSGSSDLDADGVTDHRYAMGFARHPNMP